MQTSSFEQYNKQEKWNPYIEKQLFHLVVEYKFNFQKISRELAAICKAIGQKPVSQRNCEIKWTEIHQRRLISNENQNFLQEQIRMEKMRKCLDSFQNPNTVMTVNELIAKLPQKREKKDFLDIKQEQKQFNALKESVRGNINEDLRKQERKQKEQDFLSQLDLIGTESEKESEGPQMFKVMFDHTGRMLIQKQQLNQQAVQTIMMQKVDLSRNTGVQQNEDFVDENYVSIFKEKLTLQELQSDAEPLIKQDNVQIFEDFDTEHNQDLKLIQNGVITLEDAVNKLTELELASVNEQNFEELPNRPLDLDSFKVQAEHQVQQILKEKIGQIKQSRKKIDEENFEEDNDYSSEEDEDTFLESQRSQIKYDKESQRRLKTKKQKKQNQVDKKKVSFSLEGKNKLQNEIVREYQSSQKEQISEDDNQLDLSVPDPKLDEATRFRDELIEKQKKREEEQRKKDIQQIEEIEKRIQQDQALREQIKREAKLKKIEDQLTQLAQAKKQEEERQKQIELEELDKKLRYYESQYEESQNRRIYAKNIEIQLSIKKFNQLRNYFNPQISYLQQISSLPSIIQCMIDDNSEYEKSRDGITNRYQILVFPYLENSEYLQEFLQFFLINSNIRNDHMNHGPIINRVGFPFFLVSFQIGTIIKDIMDESARVFIPRYVQMEKFNGDNLKKCIYLFFDTHIGRGSQILQAKIENITLGNILSPKTLQRLCKFFPQIAEYTKLSDFCIDHIRRMDEICRVFYKTHTMHQIGINSQKSDQTILIIREYKELIVNQIPQNSEFQTQFSTILSTLNEPGNIYDSQSSTQFLQQSAYRYFSNLNYLIQKLDQKNIQIIGLRCVYLSENNIKEIHTFDHLHLYQNKPIILIAIQGQNLSHKLEKIIGSEDPKLAKQIQQNSVNALYHDNKEQTIIYPQRKETSDKLLSYFFAGRLQNVQTVEQVKKIDGEIVEEKKYFTSPYKTPTFFFLDQLEPEDLLLIVSPKIMIQNYTVFIRTLLKKGFQIQKISTFPYEYYMNTIDRLKAQDEALGNFKFLAESSKREPNNILLIQCQGHSFSLLRKNFLDKHFGYNFMIHPSKNQLIFPIRGDFKFQFVREIEQKTKIQAETPVFTENDKFQHFLLIVPMNEEINLNQILDFFIKNKMELLCIEEMDQYDLIRSTIYRSLNLSNINKKRQEPSIYCDRVLKLIEKTPHQLMFYRLQDSNSKVWENLKKELQVSHVFVNSNLHIEESSILKFGAKNLTDLKVFEDAIQFHLLHIPSDQIRKYSEAFLLTDDVTYTNSFIYDMPVQGSQILQSLIVFDENFTQLLSLSGIIKKFETSGFTIVEIHLKKMPDEIWDVIDQSFNKINFQNMNLNELEAFNLKYQVKNEFKKRVTKNRFYMMVVSQVNGIFEAKLIIKDLIQKYSLLSKEEIQDPIVYQLSLGIYSSLDFEATQLELPILKKQIKQQPQIYQQTVPKNDKLLLMMISDQFVKEQNFFTVLQDLQGYQAKIEEIWHMIQTPQDFNQFQCLHEAFSEQGKLTSFPMAQQIHLTIMILDVQRVLKISDIFGFGRILDNGSWQYSIVGKLIKPNQVGLYLINKNQTQIEKFRQLWFQ